MGVPLNVTGTHVTTADGAGITNQLLARLPSEDWTREARTSIGQSSTMRSAQRSILTSGSGRCSRALRTVHGCGCDVAS